MQEAKVNEHNGVGSSEVNETETKVMVQINRKQGQSTTTGTIPGTPKTKYKRRSANSSQKMDLFKV